MSSLVLITGASGEIGNALCLAFAKKGFNIAVQYCNNKAAAQKLCREIEENFNVRAECFQADFSSSGSAKKLAAEVSAFGEVSVLVNNAGIAHKDVFQFVDEETTEKIFRVNTSSAMSLTKYILPQMIKKQSGRIINISSMWGITGGSCEVHYSASKAALIGFTKALCKEVGPSGITVNCIAPGLIDTKMNSALSKEDIDAIVDETPLGRIGKAQDVAELAVFLAGEGADFITGQIISVDGGLCV